MSDDGKGGRESGYGKYKPDEGMLLEGCARSYRTLRTVFPGALPQALRATLRSACPSGPYSFPFEWRADGQVADGTGDVPVRQSKPPDALLNVHSVRNAGSMKSIGQRLCAVGFG